MKIGCTLSTEQLHNGEKNEKEKSANEVNRAGAWERERVVEPEDMPLMLPICPPPIKLSLIFQHNYTVLNRC